VADEPVREPEMPPPATERRGVPDRLAELLGPRPWLQGLLVALAVTAVYLLTRPPSSAFDQYVRLADAFLDGRTWLVNPPDYLELARYGPTGAPCAGAAPGCRGFVVEPPVPALVLLPLVVLFGTTVDTVLVSLLVAAVGVGLFWVATRLRGWTYGRSAALTVLMAFGTGFWWAAVNGSVWTFAHVCAVTFLAAAFVEASGRRRGWLVGLLLGLAGLSRLPVFLAFPFFLALLAGPGGLRSAWREPRLRGFAATLAGAAAVVPLYNLLRYGTVADLGYDHPQYSNVPFFADGRFSLSYVPRELGAILFQGPVVVDAFPWFVPSTIGMGLFLVSPALLYAWGARRGRLEAAAAVATLLVAVPHLLYGAVGFAQFGYRYALDYLPMLLVLAASGMGERPGRRAWIAVALSVAVAAWGPLYFFDTPIESLLGVSWHLPPG
jgi:4-amino-4-deoxy-L-arabinose transferase-like glycosyltransferase